MTSMTREEFIVYAEELLFGEGSECLFERIAEIKSEIAMFGDSGPGSIYHLREDVAQYNRVGATWSRLTGRKFSPVAIPCSR